MRLTLTLGAMALLGIAACDTNNTSSTEVTAAAAPAATPEAVAACIDGVNVETGGAPTEVVSSESSEIGSMVTIAAGGETFTCTAANDGAIAEVLRAG